VVLFECLNGTRPFVADSPIATALAHIRDEVPPLPDTVPPALAAVVRRALAKAPAERYADGAALAAALRDAGDQGGAAVPPPAATQVMPVAVPAAAAPDTRETAPVTEPPARVTTTEKSNRGPLYAAAAVVLVVLAALLIWHPWTDSTDSDGSNPAQDTVEVRAADYIGDPVSQVEDALAAKGLKTTTHEVDNSGKHDANTVADLSPTGQVDTGSTITLDVWGEPASDKPEKTKGPDKTKSPKPEPSKPATPDTPGPSGNSGNGGGNGNDNGNGDGTSSSPAPGGRASSNAQPSTGTKGD
jgi:serine/threonine-protein kinase